MSEHMNAAEIALRLNAQHIADLTARLAAAEAERDAALARMKVFADPQVSDVEVEAALTNEGVITWGPDGEIFERMFRQVMEARAAINAISRGDHLPSAGDAGEG